MTPRRSRALGRWLALLAIALVAAGVLLAVTNPTIEEQRQWPGSATATPYTCLAPYDTVLLGADNIPGGEPALNDATIAAHCRRAGRTRFHQGLALIGLAALIGAGGIASAVAARRVSA